MARRKLSNKQAAQIKRLYADGATMRELSQEFGICLSSINQILKGISYKDDKLEGITIRRRYLLIPRSKGKY